MPEITLTAGELPPPACYATEQERLEAYVAAILATITSGAEWQASTDAPSDVDLYWLRLDSNLRPVAILRYSEADGRYIRLLSAPAVDGSPGGGGNAYTLSFTPQFTSATAQQAGRRYTFAAPFSNTGACTLNVDGSGAMDIVKHGGTPLAAGDIVIGQVVEVIVNDGEAWLQTPVPAPTPNVRSSFLSVEGAVPAAGGQTAIPHGLAGKPVACMVVLECTTADAGYSVGDYATLDRVTADIGPSGFVPSLTADMDLTNVNVNRVAPLGASGTQIVNKGAVTVSSAFNDANFKLRISVI